MSFDKNTAFDVVIPVHKKDLSTLKYVIAGVKKNLVGCRKIITVSKEKYSDDAIWFDESLYPFSFQEVGNLVSGKNVGWNYQQLLKLYACLVIPDILPNVVVVDADTVFYRRVRFFSPDNLPLYNLCKDKNLDKSNFHQTALRHINKIMPEIAQKFPPQFENRSGICHHMLFQKHIIEDLFAKIEKLNDNGDKFYEIFLKQRENDCGISEYNLYFFFLISFYPKDYQIRLLKYKNTSKFHPLFEKLRAKYHYCSYHSYMR